MANFDPIIEPREGATTSVPVTEETSIKRWLIGGGILAAVVLAVLAVILFR
jgi:hypothetical protein